MNEQNFGDLARRDTERHLLVAVDESDNSRRAVMYVADFFSGYADVFVTLLSIIREPSEDFFPTEAERQTWLRNKEAEIQKRLADYKEILLGAGLQESQIETRLSIRPCASIGDAILEEQEKLRCCIVVVGRRGISHSEEFVLGSTSSKILHHAKHCAVMVVE
ncbi:MAG: universal stress protein [Proteobacteria bacterium]|nr:universal stress protein [Pseudomonadota bacterium]MBU1649701.1 universal stress protein [Pseudomonadota bacterium]